MIGQGTPAGQQSVFGNDLATFLDPNDRLRKLAGIIPWNVLIADVSVHYVPAKGRPSLPLRLLIGLVILKHTYDVSDEKLVETWRQNPYWQFFCGEPVMRWSLPCDPSELTRFRKRIGTEGCERILKASITVQAQRVDATGDVVIDSTAQEKHITYPTFAKLDVKVIERCRLLAERHGIELRRSYTRAVAKLRITARSYRHKNPKVRKAARKAERRIRTIARCLLRELHRKLPVQVLKDHAELFRIMGVVTRQDATPGTERIHSLHEPEVVCIAKGKPHKPYEFGCKASIAVDPVSGLIIAAHHMPGKQHDRASVPDTLAQITRLTGHTPKRAICDLGYRGKKTEGTTDIITPDALKGKTGSTRSRLRAALRRRQVVEATIGRLKFLQRMGRNFLKGIIGDQMNILLAAAGHNFRRWLRYFCHHIQTAVSLFFLFIRTVVGQNRQQVVPVLAIG
jgi:IS5 family transposase